MRFPGFEGEWEEFKLSELGKFLGGGTPVSTNLEFWNGSIPWISSSDLDEDIIHYVKVNRFITQDAIDNSAAKLCVAPVILIVSRVGVGKVAYSIQDVCTSQDFTNIIDIRCNGIFLTYLLSKVMKKEASKVQGTSIKGLASSEIKSIQVYIPKKKEQQTIAIFHSLIDERIQCQSKIIEELKSFKSAISKKVFSQELQFKDENGNNYPEWKKITLADCLDYEQPTNYLVSSTEYHDKFETPVVTAGKTFILGYTDEIKGIFNENLPVIIFDDFTTSTQFINFPFKAKSSAMKILKAKRDINIRFIYEAMQMINYEIGGHGRHWISVFEKMNILIPSILEQNKIANFLSGIDEKVEIEISLLQQLKLQKQYFLKQMFI